MSKQNCDGCGKPERSGDHSSKIIDSEDGKFCRRCLDEAGSCSKPKKLTNLISAIGVGLIVYAWVMLLNQGGGM